MHHACTTIEQPILHRLRAKGHAGARATPCIVQHTLAASTRKGETDALMDRARAFKPNPKDKALNRHPGR